MADDLPALATEGSATRDRLRAKSTGTVARGLLDDSVLERCTWLNGFKIFGLSGFALVIAA